MKRDEFASPKEKVKKRAYITFIIDESGSMFGVRDATITGINEQIQQIQKDFGSKTDDIETIVSLIKFNGETIPVFMHRPLSDLKEITAEDYTPGGNTAMYDAVGFAINALNERKDINEEATSSLLIVVSDGQENASRNFTSQSLADVINKLNETKRWTITYLGANQDLSKVSQTTGFNRTNMATFDSHSNAGVSRAFRVNAMAVSHYADNLASAELSYSAASFYDTAEKELKAEEEKLVK